MQQFPCPACGRLISADVPPGTAVQCPLCQQAVTVPPPGGQPGAGGPPHVAAPPPTQVGGPMAPVSYSGATYEKPKQGMAVTSLVSGILSLTACPGVAALVGLITGIIALVRSNRDSRRYGGNGMAIAGIVTSCLGMIVGVVVVPLIISIMLPSLSRARELSKRTVCAANMRGIGQAMYIYAQGEPNGAFPDDIQKLLSSGWVTSQSFQCPSAAPGHQCYYYVPGQTTKSDPSGVLMFEDPANHGKEGGNVLFQDSHVQFVKGAQFQKIVNDNMPNAQ